MDTSINIADNYISMLSPLSDDVKLRIINKLTESLIYKKKETSITESFGAWVDSRSAEEIIEDIRRSRVLGTRHIEPFD